MIITSQCLGWARRISNVVLSLGSCLLGSHEIGIVPTNKNCFEPTSGLVCKKRLVRYTVYLQYRACAHLHYTVVRILQPYEGL